MTFDTTMGGSGKRFPETRHSLVRDAGDPDPEVRRRALGVLIASYWKPVYKCLRIHWRVSNEDAKDLTQGFFASLLESPTLARFDPARAKFRTYLRTCLERYVANERKAALVHEALGRHEDFYTLRARPGHRSTMNVVFRLNDPEQDARFVAEALAEGLYALKGHRFLGGIRASMYNGMPTEGAEALAAFIDHFARRNG